MEKKYGKPVLWMGAGVLLILGVSKAIFMAVSWGHGLRGEYFKDKNLARFAFSRVDKKINFNWNQNSPQKNFSADIFSVRWAGGIYIPEKDTYEFVTISDDGVRLWIDDVKIIDNWAPHSETTDRGSIALESGLHRIRLEYFEAASGATIRLLWKYGSMKKPRVVGMRFLKSDMPL